MPPLGSSIAYIKTDVKNNFEATTFIAVARSRQGLPSLAEEGWRGAPGWLPWWVRMVGPVGSLNVGPGFSQDCPSQGPAIAQ